MGDKAGKHCFDYILLSAFLLYFDLCEDVWRGVTCHAVASRRSGARPLELRCSSLVLAAELLCASVILSVGKNELIHIQLSVIFIFTY